MRLRRHKEHSITAINDLSLIAHKLPENIVSEIFTYDRVKKLMESILSSENSPDHLDTVSSSDMNSRRTYLAALLVEEGIKICIEKYVAQNRETPILTEATVGQLKQAIKICNEIAYMVDLPTRRESENDLEYLFNWSRVPGADESKFVDLIESISGPIYKNFKDDGISAHETRKNEPLNSSYATAQELQSTGVSQRMSEIVLNIIGQYDEVVGRFSFKLLFGTKAVTLEYVSYTGKGSMQLDTNDIIVKQDHGNYYIYRRK